MASAATSCHACGKSGGKLLLCGRCRNVWFCNRECQVVARQELGHRGANCRPAKESSRPTISASTEVMPVDRARLDRRYAVLVSLADRANMANTRIGLLAAVDKYREAASVADLIGGEDGALRCADAGKSLSRSLVRLGDLAAAARAACSSLRAARASGSRTMLVSSLSMCGEVAGEAPSKMISAERESREQKKLSGSPSSFGGLDLSKEGRISLPTTPAALSRLDLAYFEAAVAICDAAGGRGSLATNDDRRVPLVGVKAEAEARGGHGRCLYRLGEKRQQLGAPSACCSAAASRVADGGARPQHSRRAADARRPAVCFGGSVVLPSFQRSDGSRGVPARGTRALRGLRGCVSDREDTVARDQPLWRGSRNGGARRGRDVPRAAEPAPCPDVQRARDELLDLPRASRAVSRRRSGRRGRPRGHRPV